MLFMQPVVVNDAQADRATAAEVRQAEPRAAEEQGTWTGWAEMMLAQDSMGGRSPFGPNAPDTNNLTPRPTPASPPASTVEPPATPAAANPEDSAATVPGQQTDAGPPGAETGRPGGVPSSDNSGSDNSGALAPLGTGGAVRVSGTGGTSGAGRPAPEASWGTPPNPYQPSSSTFPGAREATLPGSSSGASNTQ